MVLAGRRQQAYTIRHRPWHTMSELKRPWAFYWGHGNTSWLCEDTLAHCTRHTPTYAQIETQPAGHGHVKPRGQRLSGRCLHHHGRCPPYCCCQFHLPCHLALCPAPRQAGIAKPPTAAWPPGRGHQWVCPPGRQQQPRCWTRCAVGVAHGGASLLPVSHRVRVLATWAGIPPRRQAQGQGSRGHPRVRVAARRWRLWRWGSCRARCRTHCCPGEPVMRVEAAAAISGARPAVLAAPWLRRDWQRSSLYLVVIPSQVAPRCPDVEMLLAAGPRTAPRSPVTHRRTATPVHPAHSTQHMAPVMTRARAQHDPQHACVHPVTASCGHPTQGRHRRLLPSYPCHHQPCRTTRQTEWKGWREWCQHCARSRWIETCLWQQGTRRLAPPVLAILQGRAATQG